MLPAGEKVLIKKGEIAEEFSKYFKVYVNNLD